MIPASRSYPPQGLPPADRPVSAVGGAGWGRPQPAAGLAPDAKLATVAREFEGIFLSQLLRDARKGGLAEGLFDSPETRTFQDMLDTEIARSAGGGLELGIARALVDQLSPALGTGR